MRLIRYLVTFTMVTALLIAAVAQPVAAAADRQVTLTIRTVIENPSSTPASVKLSIPLISDDSSPYQTLVSEAFSPEPTEIEEGSEGRTAFFEVRVPSGQSVTIEERYVLAISPYRTPEAGTYTLSDADRMRYLRAESGIEADHPTLREVALRVTTGVDGAHAVAKEVFGFVRQHMRYDADSSARNRGALAGYQAGAGVCEEFASLFVALTRAAGVPARVVNGYVLLDAHGRLADEGFVRRVRHQWAEYFDPDYGWVPVDPTFDADPHDSLSRPAYVLQNFGDRPITGTARGGQVKVSRGVTVDETSVQTALQQP
ncbi:MAG TPA: transglutaminase domain-containing protein [Bacillota bacterium]